MCIFFIVLLMIYYFTGNIIQEAVGAIVASWALTARPTSL